MLRWFGWLKLFPHSWHVYGFSPVWIRMCLLKSAFCMKLLPHCGQVKGLSPTWSLAWWSLRLLLCLNLFPHWGQTYGFTEVWTLKWSLKLLLYVKLFPHWWHVYGRSPVWILMWVIRIPFRVKLFPHWGQVMEALASVLVLNAILFNFYHIFPECGFWCRCSFSTSFSWVCLFTSFRSKIWHFKSLKSIQKRNKRETS